MLDELVIGVVVEVETISDDLEDRIGAMHGGYAAQVDHRKGFKLARHFEEVGDAALLAGCEEGVIVTGDSLMVLEGQVLPKEDL